MNNKYKLLRQLKKDPEKWERAKQIRQDCRDTYLTKSETRQYLDDEARGFRYPATSHINRIIPWLPHLFAAASIPTSLGCLISGSDTFHTNGDSGKIALIGSVGAGVYILGQAGLVALSNLSRNYSKKTERSSIDEVHKAAQTQRYIMNKGPKPSFIETKADLPRYAPGNL